ncbi:MAG: hypothetical protein NC124_03480 [Clostridium sp.]|nr:hypothetical protein [Clostridium sp.]
MKVNALLNQAKQTLLFYAEKGYESGRIPGASYTSSGIMPEEPDTYEWFLWQIIRLHFYDEYHQLGKITELLLHMHENNLLVDIEPDNVA